MSTIALRNSRRVNVILIIAIVVLFLPATLSTSARAALQQQSEESFADQRQDPDPFLAPDVEVERLDSSPAPELDDDQPTEDALAKEEKDKWALDDDDRMSDEEMKKELFGDDDSERESELNITTPTSEKEDNDDASQTEGDRENLAPRQTIEQFLKGINSLSIDTRTPPSTDREGVDIPMAIMPPIKSAPYRRYPVTGIRYQTPDIHHNPLYFEDRAAERGGIDHGLRQPIVSARKFVGDVVKLPKNIHKARPRSCEYHQNLRYSLPGLIRN